jgi:hypothetical protein
MSRRDGGDAIRTSVETAYSVLGEDLRCAMCHDHPFSDHTEKGCYEFAACFAGKSEIHFPRDYKYPDNKPGDVVQPALLQLATAWRPGIREDEDKLVQVARWLTQDESSKRFALVAALRIWSGLFGMPNQIIDRTVGGVDDEPSWQEIHHNCFSMSSRGATWIGMDINAPGDLSQATNLLIEEFIRCEGRLGEFQRILARTSAYSRSSIDYNRSGIAYNWTWSDCYLAPAPQIRRLPSEVIWKTLTGETDVQLPQVPRPGHPLRMLGRGTREWTDESRTPLSHELVRFMMNGELVAQTAAKAGNPEGMFLELLGREPTETERAAILHTAASDQDVAWALLNTQEFMFRP